MRESEMAGVGEIIQLGLADGEQAAGFGQIAPPLYAATGRPCQAESAPNVLDRRDFRLLKSSG